MYIMFFSEEKLKCFSLENKCDFYIICNILNFNFLDGWKSLKILLRLFKIVVVYYMVLIFRMFLCGVS